MRRNTVSATPTWRMGFPTHITCGATIYVWLERLTQPSSNSRSRINSRKTGTGPTALIPHSTGIAPTTSICSHARSSMREAEQYIREAMQLRPTTAYAAYGKKMLPDFLLARGRKEEALAAATEMQKSKWPLSRLEGHVLAGRDLLALNRVEEARAQLAAAENEIPEARKDFTGVMTLERFAGEELEE